VQVSQQETNLTEAKQVLSTACPRKNGPPKYNVVQYSKYLANITEIFTTEFSTYLYIVCKNLWKFNVEITFYYIFSITRSKQVTMTTHTHARSQLSPMKQCDYSSIVVTFFLTKNFNYDKIFGTKYNYDKIFGTKHHFVFVLPMRQLHRC